MIIPSGQVYGALTVLNRAKNTSTGSARYMCRCSCGFVQSYRASELRNGKRTKCHVCDRIARRQASRSDDSRTATGRKPSHPTFEGRS